MKKYLLATYLFLFSISSKAYEPVLLYENQPSNDFAFMPGEFSMDTVILKKYCSENIKSVLCGYNMFENFIIGIEQSVFDATVEIYIYMCAHEDYIEEISIRRYTQECLDYNGHEVDGEKGSLPFSEVLKLELGRLRDYGALLATDSMVNAFISKLLDYAHSGCSNPDGCYDMCKDIDGLLYANGNPYTLVGQGRCCSVLKDSTSGFVQTALAAVPLKVRPLTDKRFFVENGQGKAYDIFDLNGKRIGGGTFRSNVLHVKSLPAILKVEGMGSVLLK